MSRKLHPHALVGVLDVTIIDRPSGGTTQVRVREEAFMGKALLGTHATPGSLRLLDEVRALRTRVAELERALAEAERARDERADAEVVRVEAREPART